MFFFCWYYMSRNYCFTLNNYTEDELGCLREGTHKYIIMGKEVGAEGTPHIQGYVEFGRTCRIRGAKVNLGCDRLHLEARRGTQNEAIEYCKKEGNYEEHGEAAVQGRRSDLEAVAEGVVNGNTVRQIAQEFPVQYIKYNRGIEKLHFILNESPAWRAVQVNVIWGAAGTGKTRAAYEIDPELYAVIPGHTGVWWDGYCGQKTILLDDFYGWMPFHFLLRVLDGYKLQLEVKGGRVWAQWDRVVITSNRGPQEWYNRERDLDFAALNRRFTDVRQV